MIQYARQHHTQLTEKLQAARNTLAQHQGGGTATPVAPSAPNSANAAASAKSAKKSAGRDRGNSIVGSAAAAARQAAEELDTAKASEEALLLELDAQATLLANLTRHVLPLHTMRLHDHSDHLQKVERVLMARTEEAERRAQEAVKVAEKEEQEEKAKMALMEEYGSITEDQRQAAVSRYRKAYKLVRFSLLFSPQSITHPLQFS